MFKSHYGETVTVILAIVIGLLMSLASMVVDHLPFNYSNVFKIWAMITLVVLIASIFIPYKAWSARFTGLFPVEQGSIGHKLIDNILPSLILNTCNTLAVSAANILYNEAIPAELQLAEWGQSIIHDWPIMFIVSYIGAFIAEAVGVYVANRYCEPSCSR